MNKAYIYPVSARNKDGVYNPYLDDFMDSTSHCFDYLNRHDPSRVGVFNLLKYFWKIDFAIFHWPENIAEKKFGLLQSLFLLFMLPVLKISGVRIIYVVHNKVSHSQNRFRLKKYIAKKLMKSACLMIVHSGDGIPFINKISGGEKNVFFFPHPVSVQKPVLNPSKETDVLIWGNIAPYKGVHRFLKLVRESETVGKLRILVAGKVSSPAYLQELNHNLPENVEIRDGFLDDPQVDELIGKSRIVLFPYQEDSILSSGAFAKTMVFPVKIIGPECGAFSDFSSLPAVFTFKSEGDIIPLIQKVLDSDKPESLNGANGIIEKYSWEKFGQELCSRMKKVEENP